MKIVKNNFKLSLHPSQQEELEINGSLWERGENLFRLEYRLAGSSSSIAKLFIPSVAEMAQSPARGARRDEIWKRECLEVFIGNLSGKKSKEFAKKTAEKNYCEYNFGLDGTWNYYYFSDYRNRVESFVKALPAPLIQYQMIEGLPKITCDFELNDIRGISADLVFGICAIWRTLQNECLYFSLEHPPGKPDFHQRAYFRAVEDWGKKT